MGKNRLEAFSDGVLAIIITIMVLELKLPHQDDFTALKPLLPVFLSYVLSFINIGIYWNNHHHLFQLVQHVNGNILWANNHLLFWLSLMPFATGWMGENHFAQGPVMIYGVVLLMCGIAYAVLTKVLISQHNHNSRVASAVGKDNKGKLSVLIYAAAVPLSLIHPYLSCGLYIFVSMIWFLPDKRFEKQVKETDELAVE